MSSGQCSRTGGGQVDARRPGRGPVLRVQTSHDGGSGEVERSGQFLKLFGN